MWQHRDARDVFGAGAIPTDAVLNPIFDSYAFAATLPARPATSCIDLCTGSGVDRRARGGARGPRVRPTQLAPQLFRPSMIFATTPGSASVVMSPSSVVLPSAILRRMRRMILPERVFGRPATIWM